MRTVAKFGFLSSAADASFRCKLDEGPFRVCTSPWIYLHLRPGRHVFHVAAVDANGLADPTPALFKWSIPKVPR